MAERNTLAAQTLAYFRRSPEVSILALFTAIWALGILVLRMPVNAPDLHSFMFVTMHYFAPITFACVFQMLVALFMLIFRRRRENYDPWLALKLIPFIMAVVFLHFNFKAWMPLINPHSFDHRYIAIDQALAPVLRLFVAVRHWAAVTSPVDVDGLYHLLFIGVFFISCSAHALFDTAKGLRRLMLAMGLSLLAGGVAYWIAPAVGPFLYQRGANASAAGAQSQMYYMYRLVQATHKLPRGYFAAPLAAMPSLHIGNMLLFVIFAKRRLRWLLIAYIPIFSWIIVESVVARWHYLIDLPFGVLLAFGCVWVADQLVPDEAKVTKPAEALAAPQLEPELAPAQD